jgi:hypothetical protein
MNDSNPSSPIARPRRPAWNKGKLAGPKPRYLGVEADDALEIAEKIEV